MTNAVKLTMSMTREEIVDLVNDKLGLSAKEKRLLVYLLDDKNSRNIGDMRRELKTTAFTLLGKTFPSLKQKMRAAGYAV